ncbi:MAG TPA: hypothetical protein VF187_05290 [Gemmatimonadales bacterium]
MRVLRPVCAVGFLALLAGPALAQERFATVDVRAGYTTPTGEAGDMLKGQSSFGGGIAIALGERLHLGLTADWAHHSEKPVIGGALDRQWNLLHSFVKIDFDVVQGEKFTLGLNAGPGMIVFSPNQVLKDATGVRTDAHFAGNVGTTFTWWFNPRIGLMGSAQADIALKKTDGQIFTEKQAVFFPLTGGFKFKI